MIPSIENLVTDQMRACIGKTSPVMELPEEISASDVRRYVEATGDRNPLWMDDAYARAAGFRGRRVPPILILQVYRRAPEWEMGDAMPWAGIELPPNFTNTRNAGHEVEWLEPVYVGDRLTIQYRLVDVYARQGRSGPMLFLKRACEIRNQDGRLVVRVTSTSAKLPAARFSGAGSAPAD
ncbi:MAG TPA: MaoC family dehydratase N-terminal domain-containing protein [Chloroflexota bacterium]|nr:MaoC family dehydratase N-terminal domain-containing protein [Chloroflexota bacterium]